MCDCSAGQLWHTQTNHALLCYEGVRNSPVNLPVLLDLHLDQ